jgi:hypothetical protein
MPTPSPPLRISRAETCWRGCGEKLRKTWWLLNRGAGLERAAGILAPVRREAALQRFGGVPAAVQHNTLPRINAASALTPEQRELADRHSSGVIATSALLALLDRGNPWLDLPAALARQVGTRLRWGCSHDFCSQFVWCG